MKLNSKIFGMMSFADRMRAMVRKTPKSEKELQRQLEQMLLACGIQPTRQRMDKASNIAIGMPDISFSCLGRAVYWEVKMPGKRPTPEQERMIQTLRSAPNNARVDVITSCEQAITILDNLLSLPLVTYENAKKTISDIE